MTVPAGISCSELDLRSDQDVHGADAVGVPDGLQWAYVGVGVFSFVQEVPGVDEELEAGVDEVPGREVEEKAMDR